MDSATKQDFILEPPSYFEYSKKLSRDSSDSTPVSPRTLLSQPRQGRQLRPRITGQHRSWSENDGQYDGLQPLKNDERSGNRDIADVVAFGTRRPKLARSRPSDGLAVHRESSMLNPSPPITAASSPIVTKEQASCDSVPRSELFTSLFPPRRPQPSYKWSRTHSEGLRYERPNSAASSTRATRRSSQSSARGKIFSRANSPNSVPVPVPIALRPPTNGRTMSSQDQVTRNIVKVETPSIETLPATPQPSLRRHSIRPREIFSAPLALVQKFRRSSKSTNRSADSKSRHRHEYELPDHDSSQRRAPTIEALHRVTSYFESKSSSPQRSSPSSVVMLRQFSGRSPYKLSRAITHSPIKPMPTSANLRRQMSIGSDDTESFSSSVREMKMGRTPNVTPEEKSTYKIKRSKSAETEVYFKIDISVRGQTSYLPSEARRIHTPPLPGTGVHGKRRGFFFDYNYPRGVESPNQSNRSIPSTHDNEDMTNAMDTPNRPLKSKTHKAEPSQALTVGRKAFTFRRPTRTDMTLVGASWLEAQLSQLGSQPSADTTETDDDDRAIKSKEWTTCPASADGYPGCAGPCGNNDPLLDWTIPEHLPSSPLCPRHPHYWRVVRQIGSQYRGCWMHGLGLDRSMRKRDHLLH